MRGLDKVAQEWGLVCLAHNMLKLAQGRSRPPPTSPSPEPQKPAQIRQFQAHTRSHFSLRCRVGHYLDGLLGVASSYPFPPRPRAPARILPRFVKLATRVLAAVAFAAVIIGSTWPSLEPGAE